MICCLCGHQFEDGEYVVRVTMNRMVPNPRTGELAFYPTTMEDGSEFKAACAVCPAKAGAPLELTGAGGRFDV